MTRSLCRQLNLIKISPTCLKCHRRHLTFPPVQTIPPNVRTLVSSKSLSGTSLSWLNIAARPPRPASALACAQEAEACAELLAVLVFLLLAVAFGMMEHQIQIQTENWSRIWSMVVDTEAGCKLLSDWCSVSRQTMYSFG